MTKSKAGKGRLFIAMTLALVLAGCSKGSQNRDEMNMDEAFVTEALPMQTTEVREGKADEVKTTADFEDLIKEAAPDSGNLFEEQVNIEVNQTAANVPSVPAAPEEDMHMLNQMKALSAAQEHPYKGIVPADYGWVDWTTLPDLAAFEKDVYGNYIIPLEVLAADEYIEYLPDYDGRIPYICCYPTNDLSVAELTIVNPLPDYLSEYEDRFLYIDTEMKTKELYQKDRLQMKEEKE